MLPMDEMDDEDVETIVCPALVESRKATLAPPLVAKLGRSGGIPLLQSAITIFPHMTGCLKSKQPMI